MIMHSDYRGGLRSPQGPDTPDRSCPPRKPVQCIARQTATMIVASSAKAAAAISEYATQFGISRSPGPCRSARKRRLGRTASKNKFYNLAEVQASPGWIERRPATNRPGGGLKQKAQFGGPRRRIARSLQWGNLRMVRRTVNRKLTFVRPSGSASNHLGRSMSYIIIPVLSVVLVRLMIAWVYPKRANWDD
jgi:hypothetical protein